MFIDLNQASILISEGSCDTEDWSNGCWKISFTITRINYILKYMKIKTVIFGYNNITQYYSFYCIFDQINAASVSIKGFF